jgi:2-phospho-L-lactate/phosphoenolpyruvate guanylyltransferase
MRESGAVWAIVPVKRFANAKRRLAPVLGCSERCELARRMFEDVLEALLRCQDVLAGTIVVTADHEAAAMGRRRGAAVVFEAEDRGINAAVRFALSRLYGSADAGVLIVPSDIPQLSPAAIAAAAQAIARPSTLAIAAAVKDGGTNLLACRPANAVPLHFGPDSFVQHTRAAQEAGLAVGVLHVPDLLLDIDRPDDLHAFQALRTKTRTHEFLSEVPFRSWPTDAPAPGRSTLVTSPQGPCHDR